MAVAAVVRPWTLEEVHRLPDDGNKYELVRGELFVTPPPGVTHETIAARLNAMLVPYVERQKLGFVYHPKSVLRVEGSEVEPDLMVRQPHPNPTRTDGDWNTAPTPILVVEILSPYTRRRDCKQKRDFYMESGVPEYWIVDPEEETVTVVTRDTRTVHSDRLVWSPGTASTPLLLSIPAMFR